MTHTTPNTSGDDAQPKDQKTTTHHGNKTLSHPDVHVATRDDYDTSKEIIEALKRQETRSPLNDENCSASGDQGFRTYKTDLPVIRVEDIEPGVLIYRPTTKPLTVYEIRSEPYTNEHGFECVDVKRHSRQHAGDNPKIATWTDDIFYASIVDEMTFLQPETVQTTLQTS